MPSKSAAVLPQFDGDEFYFVPNITEATFGSSQDVFEKAVSPFLAALGFHNPVERFRLSTVPSQGREMPTADLNALAKITCTQSRFKKNEQAQHDCALLTRGTPLTSEDNAFVKNRMDMTLAQFKDTLERVEVEHFYTQEREVKAAEYPNIADVPLKVPLEHVGIRVEGRKGQAGLFISGRVLNDDATVTNVIEMAPNAVLNAVRKALMKVKGILSVSDNLLAPVELLLLPYGGSGGVPDRPALKYVYRTAIEADFRGRKGLFYLWLDAGTGEILELVPRMGSAAATGKTFIRDPSTLSETGTEQFEIDDAPDPADPQFTLKLSGVFSRLDRAAAGYGDDELVHTNAEFDEASFSLAPTIPSVACAGSNKQFAQVDLMATISRYRTFFNRAGPALSQFPRTERKLILDGNAGCDAYGITEGIYFGSCGGYTDPTCPNTLAGFLNPAHDHTVVAHEVGHAFTGYQYGYGDGIDPVAKPRGDRLTSWCLGTTLEEGQRPPGTSSDPCPMPADQYDTFHDFADAWSQVLEDTNCFGGWWGKNSGGLNASLHCMYQGTGSSPPNHKPHSEVGGIPRLSDVGMAFNQLDDRFPEHRVAGQRGAYSDMQIASAALWAVRQGLKSRGPVLGELLYYTRFMRTLATTGWLTSSPALVKTPNGSEEIYTDREIYRYLVELEVKLANRWARFMSPGESTVNKVVSGFARAGIFMIPWGCLDGDLTTADGSLCESGESGADAVIDVAPGEDHLVRSGPRPTFHIWTGPIYKLNKSDGMRTSGIPSPATPSACNTEFQVEIASDKDFSAANLRTSNLAGGVWRSVGNDSSSGCHATWQPEVGDWNALKGASGETYLYYRVTTRKSGGSDLRVSISPAKGLFGVFDPPYLVVNDSGVADVMAPSVPGNLTGTFNFPSEISLSWSASTDNVGVVGYKVLRNGIEVRTTAGPSSIDSGLLPSTAYTYTVKAFDAAGNVSAQSSGLSVTTLAAAGPDFPSRCAAQGVLVCRGFDRAVEISPAVWPQTGLYPAADGANRGSWDSATKASGEGSLKFAIAGGTQSNSAGFWREAMTRVFGPGQTFYVQFRQRFSSEMLDLQSSFGGSGWRQVLFHESNLSCEGIEMETANERYRNFPTMASNCGRDRVITGTGAGVLLQQGENASTGFNCPESSPTSIKCAAYRPNQWITFYYKVTVGNWGQPNTIVNAWIGYEGQPLKQWINVANHTLRPDFPGAGFDYLTLTPYDPGKNGQSHATAATWYDELIVSTQPIAPPSTNTATDGAPPAAPSNLRVQ